MTAKFSSFFLVTKKKKEKEEKGDHLSPSLFDFIDGERMHSFFSRFFSRSAVDLPDGDGKKKRHCIISFLKIRKSIEWEMRVWRAWPETIFRSLRPPQRQMAPKKKEVTQSRINWGVSFPRKKVRRPSKKSSLIFIRLLPRSWQETEESENFFKTVWLDMWQRKARRKLFLLLSLQSAKSLFQIQKSSGLFFPEPQQ